MNHIFQKFVLTLAPKSFLKYLLKFETLRLDIRYVIQFVIVKGYSFGPNPSFNLEKERGYSNSSFLTIIPLKLMPYEIFYDLKQ